MNSFRSVESLFIFVSLVEELTNRFMANLPYCLEDLDEVSQTRSYLKLSLKCIQFHQVKKKQKSESEGRKF